MTNKCDHLMGYWFDSGEICLVFASRINEYDMYITFVYCPYCGVRIAATKLREEEKKDI